MSISEAVFRWFCENLDGLIDAEPNLNYLAEKENSVSIEAVPCKPVVKRYVDGGEVRQYEFVLALRDEYGDEIEKNIGTANFFEKLAELIRKKSDAGELPTLDGAEARKMECLSQGYGISNTQRTVRYQMQCRFLYYKEG